MIGHGLEHVCNSSPGSGCLYYQKSGMDYGFIALFAILGQMNLAVVKLGIWQS